MTTTQKIRWHEMEMGPEEMGDSLQKPWQVMPQDEGQLVEVAYAMDEDGIIYRRKIDRSAPDGEQARYWYTEQMLSRFDPVNGVIEA